jgi:hypothetical protein
MTDVIFESGPSGPEHDPLTEPEVDGRRPLEVPSPPKRARSGGPRSPEGKRNSSKNATKSGVLSKAPLVGDERLEDWEERVQGLTESLRPSGYLQDQLVYELAVNRQQMDRLHRSINDIVQQQLDALAELPLDDLMADVAKGTTGYVEWYEKNPNTARPVLEALENEGSEAVLDGACFASFFAAVTSASGIDSERLDLPLEFARRKFDEWTMDCVRDFLKVVAAKCGRDIDWVIKKTHLKICQAELRLTLRDREAERDRQLKSAQALLPPSAELEKLMRYGSYLDKQYDKLMHRLEIAQRAQDKDLPAPVRVTVQDI